MIKHKLFHKKKTYLNQKINFFKEQQKIYILAAKHKTAKAFAFGQAYPTCSLLLPSLPGCAWCQAYLTCACHQTPPPFAERVKEAPGLTKDADLISQNSCQIRTIRICVVFLILWALFQPNLILWAYFQPNLVLS